MRAGFFPMAIVFVIAGLQLTLAAKVEAEGARVWKVGTPIVTYYAGPPMTEEVARQMAEGGFNVVWCKADELDLVHRHGLRGMVHDGLLAPASLDTPQQQAKLDALINRVRKHPGFYSYYIIDEPNASAFPAYGKLVAHLRKRDPEHMAYINLFPTYATNQQLGTQGDVVTAYREYVRQFLETVKPMLLSYDNYQFMADGDGDQYFLNLSMIRQASEEAGLPFLNIVQACSWNPSVRVPVPDEMRYLVYTTAAYGAKGISYFVYSHQIAGPSGGIALPDGMPTPLYHAVKLLNREFVAVVTELQQLRCQGVYHTALKDPGCVPLPQDAPFRLARSDLKDEARGMMLAYFGKGKKPSHVLVVNLDYKAEASTMLIGPGTLKVFDATKRTWSSMKGPQIELRLPPGGGKLVRVRQ